MGSDDDDDESSVPGRKDKNVLQMQKQSDGDEADEEVRMSKQREAGHVLWLHTSCGHKTRRDISGTCPGELPGHSLEIS